MSKSKLPPDVIEFFRKHGSRGGKRAKALMTPAERQERARKAGLAAGGKMTASERSARARKAGLARRGKGR